MSSFPQQVRQRRVFYIPGYDPYPARRYRELYRTEGKKQAEISGYRLAVRAWDGARYGWEVATEIDGVRTRSRVEVLEWTDIVRATMDNTVGGTYLQLLRTAWIYIGSGALRRLMWLRKGPILAGFYPVAMLLLQLFLAVLAGRIVGGLVAAGAGWALGWLLPWMGWAWLGWLTGAPLAIYLLYQFRKIDRRLYAYYLMHDFAYTVKDHGAYPEELDARLKTFTDAVAQAMAGDADEVLVVGHSSGAHLAVTVVADLIRSGRVPANGPALGLLTLGQAIPMVSFLPKAKKLRRDLHRLSQEERITWIDVSAPSDGCSFALCDPVAVSGVAPPRGRRWPLVLSAAFTQTLSAETRKRLRWRYFRLHFQYLCAFDQPEGYDYFRITAGPDSLAARFADRKPSMNRIDVPASRYTSMAA